MWYELVWPTYTYPPPPSLGWEPGSSFPESTGCRESAVRPFGSTLPSPLGQQIRILPFVSIGIMLDCQVYQDPLPFPRHTNTSHKDQLISWTCLGICFLCYQVIIKKAMAFFVWFYLSFLNPSWKLRSGSILFLTTLILTHFVIIYTCYTSGTSPFGSYRPLSAGWYHCLTFSLSQSLDFISA